MLFRMKRLLFRAALLLPIAAAVPPSAAQAQEDGWDGTRVLEMVRRAQERRAESLVDTGLVDYQADARGYIYYYLDRTDVDERTLVKTDQVALDIFWRAPDQAKQRIIGLRDVRNLPTNIHYHEDHLTVVMDNFGDLIRLGDGDEVSDVLHPTAGSAPEFYEYRLADSLVIRLPGAGEPVRVHRIEVRPRQPDRPAFVGSMFVDEGGGDIVRMEFTFTRASYVDRQLDYINVLLERGLFRGRFWLPERQQVEIRRQLPELGFPVGGMIRGTMRIGNYRFNQGLPPSVFRGRWLESVPVAQRRAFAFEDPIDAELRAEGLGPDTELAAVRRQAAALMRARVLSGLPTTRLDLASSSGTLRYNRAEGLALGAGMRTRPDERTTLALRGGVATGPPHPFGEALAERAAGSGRLRLSGYLNRVGDVGIAPAASGVINTLTGLLAGRDFTEPFYVHGASLEVLGRPGGWTPSAAARLEWHRGAEQEATFGAFGDHFRPVQPVDEGTFVGGEARLRRAPSAQVRRGVTLGVAAEGGTLRADDGARYTFVQPRGEAGWVRRWSGRETEVDVTASAGAALGTIPVQALYLLGGRGTLPGHAFRAFGGDRFALARATVSTELYAPWLRGRLLGAAGWADAGAPGSEAALRWGAVPIPGGRASVGAGLGIFYDILHVDLARGIGPGGRWELIVEANPTFWDFL
jgi:hypothetical protein